MAFPAGTECYSADAAPVRARGTQFPPEGLDGDGRAAVAEVLWDPEGKQEVEELVASVPGTEFHSDGIREILASDEQPVDDWRAGEAVAQAHLETSAGCAFPWGPRRDLKNPLGSPPGAELVGFDKGYEPPRLAIGEVKTSGQKASPPSVIYGDDGLRAQLVAARDDADIAKNLLRWLGFRAAGRPWLQDYCEATKRFLNDAGDVSIFGVLVRTVEPDDGDLRAMATFLATDTNGPATIRLDALYVSGEWLIEVCAPPGEAP